MSFVIDPALDKKEDTSAVLESINATDNAAFFKACEKNRELLRSIEVVVPVRPSDGMNCVLSRMLSIWYGEGVCWSQLNDHMGGFIETTRANIAYDFVHRQRNSRIKYLLMIDNDMEPLLSLPLLLARHDLPVVGSVAVYYHEKDGPRAAFTVEGHDGNYYWPQLRKHKMPTKGLVKCGHVGTGAIMIRKDVFESFTFEGSAGHDKIEKAKKEGTGLVLSPRDVELFHAPDVPFYVPEKVRVDGAKVGRLLVGEDLAFCEQIREKGFDCYVDVEAQVGHRKTMCMKWGGDFTDSSIDSKHWKLTDGGDPVGACRNGPE